MQARIKRYIRELAEWALGGRLAKLEEDLRRTTAERDEHAAHQTLLQKAHDDLLADREVLVLSMEKMETALIEAQAARDAAEASRATLEAELFKAREQFYRASGKRADFRVSTEELVSYLRGGGVSAATDDRITIHVGFGHAATTSLQLAFFQQCEAIFYPGVPYHDAGGFFSYLRSREDYLLDSEEMLRLCQQTVYAHPERRGRPIGISDELFCEPAEVYYDPRQLPGDVVAARLKRYFPTARIVFTIRHQPDYVRSLYFNLKRNYGYLAGMPMPPFDEWWQGRLHSQCRGTQLVNLDYAPLVREYVKLFGADRILVLPLEELKSHGAETYLRRLCEFMEVPYRDVYAERFRKPHNERMSVVEERVAELFAARHQDSLVRKALENHSLADLTAAAPRATLTLSEDVLLEIRNRVSGGNRWLAETFQLPLADYGYFV